MPRAWMASGHAWAGLGEMPPGPLVGYLCRSASLLYALHGATVLLGIDLAEGMPPWWTAVEGPAFAATGTMVLVLQWRAGR